MPEPETTPTPAEPEVNANVQRIAEVAGASAAYASAAEYGAYISALADILKRGLSLSEQWDLARTVEAEGQKLKALCGQLRRAYPEVTEVAGAEVANRLVLPGESE